MGENENLRIVRASVDDVPLLLDFIHELAEQEKFPDDLTVTEQDLRETLFGANPAAEVVIGYVEEDPVSFAVFYHTFATSTGKRGLHLDDLFVRPRAQGKGFGKKMLGYLANLASERGCARFEWWTLEWNERAIAFYEGVGARNLSHLRIFRLSDDSLEKVARLR
ncbi:MAG: GNAT family N-acetyltransferase [Planctomycetes bacterium]|jgi:GNAT superfamily N-acetyltransferase|nr:GNAT family N-acetyltransferase [Planctomycetota bacterium]